MLALVRLTIFGLIFVHFCYNLNGMFEIVRLSKIDIPKWPDVYLFRYSCICVNGYEGKNCENNVNDCMAMPCLYGGTCHDRIASFHCECPPGRTGLFCHLKDACASNPCNSAAICDTSIFNGSYTCSCPPGFNGTDCNQDIDECLEGLKLKFYINFFFEFQYLRKVSNYRVPLWTRRYLCQYTRIISLRLSGWVQRTKMWRKYKWMPVKSLPKWGNMHWRKRKL